MSETTADARPISDLVEALGENDIEIQETIEGNLFSTADVQDPKLDNTWTPEHSLIAGACVLAFGLIVVFVMARLISKGEKASTVTKTLALPLIVVSAIFLVVVGFSNCLLYTSPSPRDRG